MDAWLADRIEAGYPDVRALAVARGGEIVLERYWHGYAADEPHEIRSATKSVTSALVGVALGRGELAGLDQPLAALFPEHLAGRRDGAELITLRHALAMTAGLDWDDDRDWGRLLAADDWVALVLGAPLAHPPGHAFAYNTGLSQVVATALVRATGVPLGRYAAAHLFAPLGIVPRRWPIDPRGGSSWVASGCG